MLKISGLSFQQIEIFLSAAKYENFTHAAEELHMTQASVSRNISDIELKLGLVLFLRHKQRVRLTNAGKLLCRDWQEVLNQAEASIENAFLQQQNQFRRISVGDNNLAKTETYLLPIVESFERENPEVKLTIERIDPIDEMKNLKDGKYDAAFVSCTAKQTLKDMGLDYTVFLELNPCLVISSKHPLFKKDKIIASQLEPYQVIAAGGEYSEYLNFMREVCNDIGYQYSSVKLVDNLHTIVLELKRGSGIAILDKFFTPSDSHGLHYIELDNCTVKSGFLIAYRPDNDNPYLKKLVSICKKLFIDGLNSSV